MPNDQDLAPEQGRENSAFYFRAGLGVIVLGTILHLLYCTHLELVGDEAYYWLWSLRPDIGYFDHPPAVAWLIGLGAHLAAGEVGVRLLFFACGGLAVVFSARLAGALSSDPRAPRYAALLTAAAPMLMITGALALPDAPTTAAYAGACFFFVRADETRPRDWVLAGACMGLGLLSKYSAALMLPGLLLLTFDPVFRRALKAPWPWLAAAIAVVIFAPNLIWNARHDWASIRYQLGHGFAGRGGLQSLS